MKFAHRLVKAGWAENIINEGTNKPGIQWSIGPQPLDCGQAKTMLFGKLYSELQKGGYLTLEEVEQIAGYGQALARELGLDSPPDL